MNILFRILVVLTTSHLLVSCASSPQRNENSTGFVDVETFAVALPNSSEWTTHVDRSNKSVEAVRLRRWWTGEVLGSTMIRVFENRVMDGTERLRSEQEIANGFLSTEEMIMATASQQGTYTLESSTKGSAAIGGKTFYTLKYKTKQKHRALLDPLPQVVDAVLYVWIPANIAQEGKFYGFLISESLQEHSLLKKDLNQIVPIIESFVVK